MIIDSEVLLRIALSVDAEDENLEFKEAKDSFEFKKLVDYCAALANEGGGHIIFGVSDKRPRQIVGTNAFRNLGEVKSRIYDKLRRRVEINEFETAAGRVLAVYSPAVPRGHPIAVDGRFLMRVGGDLVGMSGERLREVLAQNALDLSSNVVDGSIEQVLDHALIRRFRDLAAARCRRQGDASSLEKATWYLSCLDTELLQNVYLTIDGNISWAAMLLLGKEDTIARYLPQAECIFEYRSSNTSIDYQERRSFRTGFLGYMDEIWSTVAKRNEVQAFQVNLIRQQIPTFAERSVREALLNAICHRSYFDQASVMIKQFPRRLEVVSPGGFPQGVTPENILNVSRPRIDYCMRQWSDAD